MTATARKTATKKSAVEAVAAEAKNVPVTFEFKGLTFEVPTDPRQLPLEVLETDDELEATRLILGKNQWKAFREMKPTVGDFWDLVEAMSTARGREGDSGN
ncbi:hypothetical protein ACFY5K_25690 [Streptomyces griseofuscus]|uniref:hypothetical protein n=1 Tax=Streptomyces griseofuscus TaxID=146922 RepID=UPI00368E29D1